MKCFKKQLHRGAKIKVERNSMQKQAPKNNGTEEV
jgi:ribosomal protein L10